MRLLGAGDENRTRAISLGSWGLRASQVHPASGGRSAEAATQPMELRGWGLFELIQDADRHPVGENRNSAIAFGWIDPSAGVWPGRNDESAAPVWGRSHLLLGRVYAYA